MNATCKAGTLNIVVGVAGGIAAYKSAHLVRYFTERGHDVHVVPTPAALNFVGAATFEALSGNPVSTTVFDAVDEVRHVRIGQEADLVVIAPATADLLSRAAQGRADDLLTSTLLVATCPVVFAPAMHTEMWRHPATQENVGKLREHGSIVLEPAHGRLTGADTGPGRLADPEHIGAMALLSVAYPGAFDRNLEGRRLVISAGGTREELDPVRYLGNHSSGRQGYALADVAVHRGAEVTLVRGDTAELPVPPGATVVDVVSARDMDAAVQDAEGNADMVIMSAAVADFRPVEVAGSKMKKGSDEDALTKLVLTENPDILAGVVSRRRQGQVVVGFAAETGDDNASPLEHAKVKLRKKGCDLLMCNDVSGGTTFGSEDNVGWLLSSDGGVSEVPEGTKHSVAAAILDRATALLPAN